MISAPVPRRTDLILVDLTCLIRNHALKSLHSICILATWTMSSTRTTELEQSGDLVDVVNRLLSNFGFQLDSNRQLSWWRTLVTRKCILTIYSWLNRIDILDYYLTCFYPLFHCLGSIWSSTFWLQS